jgi:hypothetical protein
MKGVSVSLYAFVVTMIGGTLGPLAVAQLNETVFHEPGLIGRSIALVGVCALMLSAALTLVSRRNFTRALARNGAFARVLAANSR